MKLADETLLVLIDIFRRGIIEMSDMSDPLRELDLVQGSDGKLYVNREELTSKKA